GMVRTLTLRTGQMEQALHSDFSHATELADYSADQGMPFRHAHDVAGKLVFTGIQRRYLLKDVDLAALQDASPLIRAAISATFNPKTAVQRRNALGGTGFDQVHHQLGLAKQLIG